ncbi:dermonecrotic toxin SPH-like [Haemaphysalis longicornis]
MANSLPEVGSFMEQGVNSLEADVHFTSDGTVSAIYHGIPCDCLRYCRYETPFPEYLEYLRNVTSGGGGKFKNELLLLMLDLKTKGISQKNKYKAGVDVSTKLIEHLWTKVSVDDALNVVLHVYTLKDIDLFKGVVDTVTTDRNSARGMQRLGFDFGDFGKPSKVGEAFAQLGIGSHRWQGGGMTNCLVDTLGNLQLPKMVSCRDGLRSNCDFVDKVYAWTVDTPATIKRVIKYGIDGIVTNKPKNVLTAMQQNDIASLVRLAGPQDSPWTRIVDEF